MSRAPDRPSTTVVFCIESGFFEAQTRLAIESLRRFGGRFAHAPVLAISPRFSPSLSRETRRRLGELGVTYVYRNLKHPYSWYGFLNKPLVIALAAELADTEQIIWLDSDALIAAEPELLHLEPGVDFTACATDKNVSTGGPGDGNEPYWAALCRCVGLELDELPWVVTESEKERIRFSINSGIFAFRRSTGLAPAFLEACEKVIDGRIGYGKMGLCSMEQIALGFAVIKLGLPWRLLPDSHNFYVSREPPGMYRRQDLPTARVLHYHQALSGPDYTAWMLNELAPSLPELHRWLKDRVPLDVRIGGLHRKLIRKLLHKWRDWKEVRFDATCQRFGPSS